MATCSSYEINRWVSLFGGFTEKDSYNLKTYMAWLENVLDFNNYMHIIAFANQYTGSHLQHTVLLTFSYCHFMLKILSFQAKDTVISG